MERIFTRSQIDFLRKNVISLLTHSSYYFDLMKKKREKINNPLGRCLKRIMRWCKAFSLKFLMQDISGVALVSVYKRVIEDVYIAEEFSQHMVVIQRNVRNIWKIFKDIFRMININNLKMFKTFISIIFDTRSGKTTDPIHETGMINKIVAMRNFKLKSYWISNPNLMIYMVQFQQHHLTKQVFLRRLMEPNFIVASALIMSAQNQRIVKVVNIDSETNQSRAFTVYKNLLVEINLLDNIYKETDIKQLSREWHLKRDTMNALIEDMEDKENLARQTIDIVKDIYSDKVDEADLEEAYMKKKVTERIPWEEEEEFEEEGFVRNPDYF